MENARILTHEEMQSILKLTESSRQNNSGIAEKKKEFQPLQDTQVSAMIQNFLSASKRKCADFLRRKITIQCSSVTEISINNLINDKESRAFLRYAISSFPADGYCYFDRKLLHTVITLLYGGEVSSKEPVMENWGKFGSKIVLEFGQLILKIWQEALAELAENDLSVVKIAESFQMIAPKQLTERYYDFSFDLVVAGVQEKIHILFPVPLLLQMVAKQDLLQNSVEDTISFSELLQHELVDSMVEIRACLPKVSLKLQQVAGLKPGDTIPIGEPTQGYVFLNQRKIFKITAGQQNDKRVLKVDDGV